jgi:hypothetical protein
VTVVGAILSTVPLGLGIALNPIAIVASILIVRTASSRLNAVAFLLGWIAGLALLVLLVTRLVELQLAAFRGRLPPLPALIWIVLGALLLVAAVWTFRRRPAPDAEPRPSPLLRIVDRAGLGYRIGAGLVLATVSLRNLALLAAASAVIGQAGLGPLELALTVASFVAISSLGILIPLLARLLGGTRADAWLAAWNRWLNRYMGTVTAVVLAALGAYLLVRGLIRVV